MLNIPYISAFDLAYYTVHRKTSPGKNTKLINPPIVETTTFNGIVVETVLEDQWLETLCSIQIPNMRIISISSGYNKLYLTHIIFAIMNTTSTDAYQIISRFDLNNIMAAFTMHTNNSVFISVATRNWYRFNTNENTKWKSWWKNIVEILESIIIG